MFNRVCRGCVFCFKPSWVWGPMIFCCWVVVGHCGVKCGKCVRVVWFYLLTWPVHSLSAFAIVEEAGSEFAYLHAAPCTVRNYIFERTRHWPTAERLVDQAFGGETSTGPTWCSNRRKNKTLTVKTNQFISKHKQIHNKNTNNNRQNPFPHIHLAGKLAFVAN